MQSLEEKSNRPIPGLTTDHASPTSNIQCRQNYVVTGGAGFVGSHIAEHLLNCDANVIVLDNKYPSMELLCQIEASSDQKSKFILCDITRYTDVCRAFNYFKKQQQQQWNHEQQQQQEQHSSDSLVMMASAAAQSVHASAAASDEAVGMASMNSLNSLLSLSDPKQYRIDCVFHCAALTDPWAPPSLYENINVVGTQNIIRACHECNIAKLVYTSSSCVVLDGSDCQNGDESMKYVEKKHHLNAYSYSKQRGEEFVLLANDTKCADEQHTLLTTALRPHCIFGPGDTHFISQIINKARAGKITHMIGEGHNITDFTYIDNVVHAHMLAAKALKGHHRPAAGQVYFITNGEPTLFWSFLGAIFQQLGCPRPSKYISYNVAYAIALIMEFIYMIIGWLFGWRPIITRQMVVTMACHHWFSHAKATRDLGYKPVVTLEQGIKRTVQWLQLHHRRRRFARNDGGYAAMTDRSRTNSMESFRSIRSNASSRSDSANALNAIATQNVSNAEVNIVEHNPMEPMLD